MTTTKKESEFTQREEFERAARELGCDDDPAHFDEVLKKVARHKPATQEPPQEKERAMSETDMRIKCAEIASATGLPPHKIIELAEAILVFVKKAQ